MGGKRRENLFDMAEVPSWLVVSQSNISLFSPLEPDKRTADRVCHLQKSSNILAAKKARDKNKTIIDTGNERNACPLRYAFQANRHSQATAIWAMTKPNRAIVTLIAISTHPFQFLDSSVLTALSVANIMSPEITNYFGK